MKEKVGERINRRFSNYPLGQTYELGRRMRYAKCYSNRGGCSLYKYELEPQRPSFCFSHLHPTYPLEIVSIEL